MPWLSNGGARLGGLNLSGGTTGSSGGSSSLRPPKSLLERANVNDIFAQGQNASIGRFFDEQSQNAVGVFGTLGQLPSRIMESPVSLVDTAVQRSTGFSPVKAVANTPLGTIGGAIGKGIEGASNFVPSLINSHDARVWSAIGDLPDWTEITDELVEQRLGIGGLEGFARDFGERSGGLPILGAIFGIGTRAKTVGEFRQELAKRGFFTNTETGEAIDPTMLARELREGRRSTTDFGGAAINDNALVDLAGRLALDPTNALFLVPGANIAKGAATAGRLVAKIMPAARLAEAGAIAGKAAPIAAKSAEAIAAGNRAQATLRGIGKFLRGYRTLAVGTAVGEFGLNRLTGIAVDNDIPVPFAQEINEFTSAVEANRPLSNNAAFMLFSAATFPYNATVIRPVRTAAGKLHAVTLGADDLAPFRHAFGGRDKLLTAVGGPDGLRDLHGFLLVQEARARHALTPAEEAQITSTPSLALRRKFESQAFERAGARMWTNGEITADDLLARFKTWASEQAGVVSKTEHGHIRDQGVRMEFDPERAGRTWRTFRDNVRPRFKQILDETGEAIWGERDDVLFVEQIPLARTIFRGAAYADKAGAKRVPRGVVLDFLEDNPNLNSTDRYGFWRRIIADEGDPLLRDIENKLKGQRRGAVKADDYFADARAWEQSAPADPAIPDGPLRPESTPARIDRLREEQAATVDANGTVLPDRVAEHQRIQRDLEDTVAHAKDVRWSRDKSVDPELARAATDALADADPLLAPAFVYPGLRSADPATISRVVQLEQELRDAGLHTKYRVKSLGRDQQLAVIPDSPLDVAIRQRTALGEWLFEQSPFSAVAKFIHGLTRPVTHDELARGQRQALMNDLIARGFQPGQVNAVLHALEQQVRESPSFKLGSMEARMLRDVGSLLPQQVNKIARRVLVDEAPTPAAAAKAARLLDGLDRGFYGVLSRTGSRYWRSLHAKARQGDKGAKALENVYAAWNETPVLSGLATTQRTVAKMVYPIMRFMFDPRWLALNAIEGATLAFAKDGFIKAYSAASEASRAGRTFLGRAVRGDAEALTTFAPDVGATLTNQNLQLIALKSFDKRSAKSVVKALDELGETDPAMVALRRNMAREADDLLVQAKRAEDAAEATKLRERARRLREGSRGSMAEHLNDTLYRFEKDGPDKATRTEFERFLDADEMAAMQPLIDRVAEINRQTWTDVQAMLHGNPSRSTLERIGNSYWLYWPLSYQIKATKWLADIMLNGSFGHNNGALLAGRYALWQQEHNERLKHSPGYAAMYEANPELWFAAQMLLPISPEDIGVSLGKATDLIGRRTQDFANSWFKTDIGLFTLLRDNASVPTWLTKMGPFYTAELMGRLAREAGEQGFFGAEAAQG